MEAFGVAPVFYGFQDLTVSRPPKVARSFSVADGGIGGGIPAAPNLAFNGHPVQVWFPSLDGSPAHAEILRGCGRYPLVILAHGSCPQDEEPHRSRFELPALLARSGYVVIVPMLSLGAPSANDAEQELIGELAAWARSG